MGVIAVPQPERRTGSGHVPAEATALLRFMRLRRALAVMDALGPDESANPAARRLRATILVELSWYPDADEVLRQVPRAGADDEQLDRLRARVTLGVGDTAAAVAATTALVRRYPGSVLAWCTHAQALHADGAGEEARRAVRRAAQIGPADLDVVDAALVIEAFDVARPVLEANLRGGTEALARFQQALLRLQQDGDVAMSQAALDAGRRLDPDHPYGWLVDATLLVVRGDREAAIRAVDRARAELDGPTLRVLRAMLYEAEGRFDEALEDVEQALRHQPGLPDALALRASLLAGRGDWAGVVRDTSRVLDRKPGDLEARTLRATAHLERGQTGLARRDAQAVLAAEPRNGEALLLRARASFAEGGYPQALREVNEAIAVQGQTPENLLWRIWVLVRLGGHHSEAVRDVRTILRIDPGNAAARQLLEAEKTARGEQWSGLANTIGRFFRGLS